jgi:hypothetical protein
MKTTIRNQVIKHGNDLIKAFNLAPDTDPLELCRKLHRLELKADRINTDYCNGDITEERHNEQSQIIIDKVKKLINNNDFYFNTDPRGYSLKIDDKLTREMRDKGLSIYTDWGGYGIIAPEFK